MRRVGREKRSRRRRGKRARSDDWWAATGGREGDGRTDGRSTFCQFWFQVPKRPRCEDSQRATRCDAHTAWKKLKRGSAAGKGKGCVCRERLGFFVAGDCVSGFGSGPIIKHRVRFSSVRFGVRTAGTGGKNSQSQHGGCCMEFIFTLK